MNNKGLKKLKELCEEKSHLPVYEFICGKELKPGHTYSSPMRDGDSRPSFSIYISQNGRILWKDFAYGEGDVFKAVEIKYNCNFSESIRIVSGILGVTEDQIPKPKGTATLAQIGKLFKKESKTLCYYKDAIDTAPHKAFLAEYSMNNLEYVIDHGWLPIESATIKKDDRSHTYFPFNGKSMWAIRIDSSIKFYRPGASIKYIGNTVRNDVYGIDRLVYDKDRPCLITGGHKDKLVGGYHLSDLAQTICFNSEGIIPEDSIMMNILTNSSRVFVWYDNDKAGIEGTRKIVQKHPFIIPIYHMCPQNDIAEIVREEGPSLLRNEFKNQLY